MKLIKGIKYKITTNKDIELYFSDKSRPIDVKEGSSYVCEFQKETQDCQFYIFYLEEFEGFGYFRKEDILIQNSVE